MVKRISLAHGEGGELTHQLIEDVFIKSFGHAKEAQFDAAICKTPSQNIAVTTDSYVVNPIFFPGGDIGKLAITGTVNDLAVSGAIPKFMTVGFMIEEGFPLRDLKKLVASMADEAEHAGVRIIAGDTKVVEKGSVDGLFINTTGIGEIQAQHQPQPASIKKGDAVIVSGPVGEHGISILSAREEMGVLTDVKSDCSSLNHLIQDLMNNVQGIRLMRDATRGGLATTLVELCEDFQFTVEIDELSLPISNGVKGACDILGFDPLYLANEGKLVMVVDSDSKQNVLDVMKNHRMGEGACVIGDVQSCLEEKGNVFLKTPVGTTRRLQRLSGMLLPRIC